MTAMGPEIEGLHLCHWLDSCIQTGRKLVLDTTIWLDLDKVGVVDRVIMGLPGVLVRGALANREELLRHPIGTPCPGAPLLLEGYAQSGHLFIEEMSEGELVDYVRFKPHLNPRRGVGDTECFVLANSRGWVFVTGDNGARSKISRLAPKLQVASTEDFLSVLITRRIITPVEAESLLRRLHRWPPRS